MRCTCHALPETLALTAGEKGNFLGGSGPEGSGSVYVAWEGQARKREVMLLRVIPPTRQYQGGRRESPVHTPQGPEEAAGLVLGLASGGWGWTGPRRTPDLTRAEPSGVFRTEAGLGLPGGGRSGKVTLARGGAGAA